MDQGRVGSIMGAIESVESGLDSLARGATDMQKSLAAAADSESAKLLGRVKEIAGREAASIVERARADAEAESAETKKKGEEDLARIRASIDSNFEGAVDHAVSEILQKR